MTNTEMKKCKYCASEIPKDAKICPKCQKDLRNWFIKHPILSFLGIIIIILVIAGGGDLENKKELVNNSTGINKNTENTDQKTITQQKENTIKIESTKLYSEYKANEIKADNLYKNKLLEVSGVIESIGKDLLDHPYVALKGGDMIFNVQCMLEDSSKASELKKGQKIIVIGRNSGKMGNIILESCKIK